MKNCRIATGNLNLLYNCNISTHTIKASMGLELVWNRLYIRVQQMPRHSIFLSPVYSVQLPQFTSNNTFNCMCMDYPGISSKTEYDSVYHGNMLFMYKSVPGTALWSVWESHLDGLGIGYTHHLHWKGIQLAWA